DWPANIKARKKQEQQKKEQDEKEKKGNGDQEAGKQEEKQHGKEEHEENNDEDEWRNQNNKGGQKHHGAYGKGKEQQKADENGVQQNGENQQKTEYQKLRKRYSPEEITLLRHLQHESEDMQKIQLDDGKRVSPVKSKVAHRDVSIETQDAMTPDNWVPCSGNLVRRTGSIRLTRSLV
ncbi:hypothetical protein LTR41_012189, partial [Exophiala xenobiotica]